MDKQKIKEALAYVHHWEKELGRVEAARQALMVTGLNEPEQEILLKAIHVQVSEIAKEGERHDQR